MAKKVIFKGVVQFDSWISHGSDPTEVVFSAEFPLPTVPIIEKRVNEKLELEEKLVGYNNFGLTHFALPGKYKVKKGQKITVTLE